MSKGGYEPAINRAIIENDLIEEYHWLPQDIAKIPYRDLQRYFIIRAAKIEARSSKRQVDAFQKEHQQPMNSRGQTKRIIRR